MAVTEKHNVELELLLEGFLQNIERAQKNLRKVGDTAEEVSAATGEAFEGKNTDEATSSIVRFGAALGTIIKLLVGAAGIIVGLKVVRGIMGSVASSTDKASIALSKFIQNSSTAIGSAVGMSRGFRGTTGATDKLLGRIQSATINTTVFSGAISNLRKNPAIRDFANRFVQNFDRIEGRIVNFIRTNPTNVVVRAFTAVRSAAIGVGNAVVSVVPSLSTFSTGLLKIRTGAVTAANGAATMAKSFAASIGATTQLNAALGGLSRGAAFVATTFATVRKTVTPLVAGLATSITTNFNAATASVSNFIATTPILARSMAIASNAIAGVGVAATRFAGTFTAALKPVTNFIKTSPLIVNSFAAINNGIAVVSNTAAGFGTAFTGIQRSVSNFVKTSPALAGAFNTVRNAAVATSNAAVNLGSGVAGLGSRFTKFVGTNSLVVKSLAAARLAANGVGSAFSTAAPFVRSFGRGMVLVGDALFRASVGITGLIPGVGKVARTVDAVAVTALGTKSQV